MAKLFLLTFFSTFWSSLRVILSVNIDANLYTSYLKKVRNLKIYLKFSENFLKIRDFEFHPCNPIKQKQKTIFKRGYQ